MGLGLRSKLDKPLLQMINSMSTKLFFLSTLLHISATVKIWKEGGKEVNEMKMTKLVLGRISCC